MELFNAVGKCMYIPPEKHDLLISSLLFGTLAPNEKKKIPHLDTGWFKLLLFDFTFAFSFSTTPGRTQIIFFFFFFCSFPTAFLANPVKIVVIFE